MISKVGIANMALTLLGADRILSFDDQTKSAREIKAIYDISRDEILVGHPWNFALKRVKLAKLAEEVPHGWRNQFQLPPDYLRKITVYKGKTENDELDEERFLIEEGKILTNEDQIWLKYIWRNDNPASYSAHFVTAFATKLAYEICFSITNDKQLATMLRREYDEKLRIAGAIDTQESSDVWVEGEDWFIKARS